MKKSEVQLRDHAWVYFSRRGAKTNTCFHEKCLGRYDSQSSKYEDWTSTLTAPWPTPTLLLPRPSPLGIFSPPFLPTLSVPKQSTSSEAVYHVHTGMKEIAFPSLFEVTCLLSLVKRVDEAGQGKEARGDGSRFGESSGGRIREGRVSKSLLLMIHSHISLHSALFASEMYHSCLP